VLEKSDDYQACVLHCVRDVKFYLWQTGLSKEQRKAISGQEGVVDFVILLLYMLLMEMLRL